MAAVLRKRKIIDTGFNDGPQQPGIALFTRLCKPGSLSTSTGKKSAPSTVYRRPLSTRPSTTVSTVKIEAKKPKLDHTPAASLSTAPQPTRPVTPPPSTRKSRLPSQPGNPRRIAPLKRGRTRPTNSPTQGARAILEAFVLATPAERAAETKPQKGLNENDELVELHAAFLKALSLHYAHHGTSSPADLQQLLPSITRIWARRRVTADDMRQLLGVQQCAVAVSDDSTALPMFTLVDLGHGRLCIEYEPVVTASALAAPLPVDILRRIFAAKLAALGASDLPLAPIAPYVAAPNTASAATGATRLSDLKAAARTAQTQTIRAEGRAPPTISTAQPSARTASLLARICAKEAHAAAQPAGPTAADRARQAALQRLYDIIPVISALTTQRCGGPAPTSISQGVTDASAELSAALGMDLAPRTRGTCAVSSTSSVTVSFTMLDLVRRLQQSLRHPLATEEGERCIRLLADEVLPRWVQVRAVGKMTSVSVRGTVGRAEWEESVRAAMG